MRPVQSRTWSAKMLQSQSNAAAARQTTPIFFASGDPSCNGRFMPPSPSNGVSHTVLGWERRMGRGGALRRRARVARQIQLPRLPYHLVAEAVVPLLRHHLEAELLV